MTSDHTEFRTRARRINSAGDISARSLNSFQPAIHKYISPAEFKMRVLRKLSHIDALHDSKAKFQRQNGDKTLKASILFPNGEVGTLISYEQMDTAKPDENESEVSDKIEEEEAEVTEQLHIKKQRPLRLPPINLPPIYSMKPLPVLSREFSSTSETSASVTDDQWDELQECRYLRIYSGKYRNRSNSIPA